MITTLDEAEVTRLGAYLPERLNVLEILLLSIVVVLAATLIFHSSTIDSDMKLLAMGFLFVVSLLGTMFLATVEENQLDTLECTTATVNDTPVYLCQVVEE